MIRRVWIGLALLVLLFVPVVVQGQTSTPPFTVNLQVDLPGVCDGPGESGGNCTVDETLFGRYLAAFFNYFYGVAGVLAAVMIVYGGFRWITAAGNASKISQGKEMIQSAVIGLILALTSFVILRAINPELVQLRISPVGEVQRIEQQRGAIDYCSPTLQIVREASSGLRCGDPFTYRDPATRQVHTCRARFCPPSGTGSNTQVCSELPTGWGCRPVDDSCRMASGAQCDAIDATLAAAGSNVVCRQEPRPNNPGEFTGQCYLTSIIQCDNPFSPRAVPISCSIGGTADSPCWRNNQARSETVSGIQRTCTDSARAANGLDARCCALRYRQDVICDSRPPENSPEEYVELPCSMVIHTDGTTYRDAAGDESPRTTCDSPNRCFIRLKFQT